MRCAACQHQNADGNRFCGSCGAALAAAPEAATATTQIPPTVGAGRYRTRELLGEGARKRVYLAIDERLDREVAVAVVKTDGLDANGRVRITREAQAMARLGDDPHIVTVFDVGEESDGTPFIVSQYMSGGSLTEHLEAQPNRRLPVKRALVLAEQLTRALVHAHALSIVHRDLKPENVWLDHDGAARLGDFGLGGERRSESHHDGRHGPRHRRVPRARAGVGPGSGAPLGSLRARRGDVRDALRATAVSRRRHGLGHQPAPQHAAGRAALPQ